jgi:2-polyprenyl-3-methyl-5-hydroxy-6-metoxy-1,4-benzoquinol methylase
MKTNKMIKFWNKAITSLRNFSDESRRLRKVLKNVDRSIPVLDVGCGYGRNLVLMRAMGFKNLAGVEINPSLAYRVREMGFACFSPEELEQETKIFDLLIMSHIIEHFEHMSAKAFIENHLNRLRDGGALIISTPLFHDSFYNDFDHVRPYLPLGINMVFGVAPSQVQFQSEQVLKLEAIDFFSDQWRINFHPAIYNPHSKSWPIQLNRALKLLFVISRGLIGKKIGWMGLYRYKGKRHTK